MSGGYQDISVPPANYDHSAGSQVARDDSKSPVVKDSVNPVSEKYTEDEPKEKLFNAWPGYNSPVCCGTCLMGPDRGVWVTTISLILAPTFLFVFVGQSSPSIIVSILALITCSCSMYFLCKATFTEPGIIPRNDVRQEPLWKKEEAPKIVVGHSKASQKEIPLKYCSTCHIWRPLRSKHCRDCDNCVEKFGMSSIAIDDLAELLFSR
jgi:hypothetical protein